MQLKQLRKESLKKIQAWTGFEPMTSAMPVQCSTNWVIKPTGSWSYCDLWSFIRSSNICFIYLHSFIHPSRVYYELKIWPAPSWLDSSVGRALHRHRRGHGFESRSSLNFFQAFFSQLLKWRSNCEDLFFYLIFHPQFKYMFHIFTFIQENNILQKQQTSKVLSTKFHENSPFLRITSPFIPLLILSFVLKRYVSETFRFKGKIQRFRSRRIGVKWFHFKILMMCSRCLSHDLTLYFVVFKISFCFP